MQTQMNRRRFIQGLGSALLLPAGPVIEEPVRRVVYSFAKPVPAPDPRDYWKTMSPLILLAIGGSGAFYAARHLLRSV